MNRKEARHRLIFEMLQAGTAAGLVLAARFVRNRTIFATPVGLVEETLTRGMRRGLPVTVQQDIVISADGPHILFPYRIS